MPHGKTTAIAKYLALATAPCAMADIQYEDLGLVYSYNQDEIASLPLGPLGMLFPQEVQIERDIIGKSSGTSTYSNFLVD